MLRRLAPLLLVLAAGCGATLPPPRALPPMAERTMRIHFIDVGQGDATLLEFPCAAVLVDTGAEVNEEFDGVRALRDYLDRFFAQRPDLHRSLALLAITHPHIDHASGIPEILANYTVENVIDNGWDVSSGGEQQAALHRHLKAHPEIGHRDIRLDDIAPGTLLTDTVIDPVKCPGIDPKLAVAWGRLDTNPGWTEVRYGKTPYENMNNHSIVLRVDFGRASALLTGDLEEQGIAMLLDRTKGSGLLDVDVYKVGHHGSANGTTDELVAALTPEIAIVSMGPETRRLPWTAWKYGHPRAQVIETLGQQIHRRRPPRDIAAAVSTSTFRHERLSAAIFATGWDGTVVLDLSADGRIEARTNRLIDVSERTAVGRRIVKRQTWQHTTIRQ